MRQNLALILLMFSILFDAQVGIGTITPSSSSLLELSSSNKGLKLATVELVSRNSAVPMTSHVEGMVVDNSTVSGVSPNNVISNLYYDNGAEWVLMNSDLDSPKIGDIKASFLTSDHNGWYLLNGRLVTLLSAIPQYSASTVLGLTNLPNSTDRMIKGIGSEAFGSIGGADSYSITQSNLPNLTFSGVTSFGGSHSHTYTNAGHTLYRANSSSEIGRAHV